jgi:hypothetical protein
MASHLLADGTGPLYREACRMIWPTSSGKRHEY